MSSIRYSDRVFMTGRTGCGKSTLARAMVMSAAAPRLIISPSDDEITDVPGALLVRDWRELIHLEVDDVETVRFVPLDPGDADAYNCVYRWAFDRFPRYVWLDEAGLVMPAQGWPRWGGAYIVQGRKRQLGHLALHTRPVEVAKNLIAQAAHVIAFQTPAPEDRRYLADQAAIPRELFEEAMAELDEFGFLWWDVRAQQLTSVPALSL